MDTPLGGLPESAKLFNSKADAVAHVTKMITEYGCDCEGKQNSDGSIVYDLEDHFYSIMKTKAPKNPKTKSSAKAKPKKNDNLSAKITKMKKAIKSESGHDLEFVECKNCDDITILFGPGGRFTDDGWSYCRYCGCNRNSYWCGKCDAKWTENGDKCKKCTDVE